MDKKRMEEYEREDLLLYLDSLLRCVNALHTSVGELMAEVAVMRNTILEDQQELATSRNGKRFAKESARVLDGRLYSDPSDSDLALEIASTQQYKN